MVLSVIELGSR